MHIEERSHHGNTCPTSMAIREYGMGLCPVQYKHRLSDSHVKRPWNFEEAAF